MWKSFRGGHAQHAEEEQEVNDQEVNDQEINDQEAIEESNKKDEAQEEYKELEGKDVLLSREQEERKKDMKAWLRDTYTRRVFGIAYFGG